MKCALLPFLMFLLCLQLGCGAARTEPTPEARKKGVVDSGVTLLASSWLQDGIGEIDKDAALEFQTTDSGLQYRILRGSDGQKPGMSDRVMVHYRGWLDNGREFDASYGGPPTSFGLSDVVVGWREGLQLVGVGGMIELWIPSESGYGKRGMGNAIPPDSALHFVVELLRVN